MKSIFKMIALFIGGFIVLFVAAIILFVNFRPDFGGKASEEQKKKYLLSGNYKDGKFSNQVPTDMNMDFWTGISVMREFIKGTANDKPESKLPVLKIDSLDIVNRNDTVTRLTWFGHSSFLLEMDGMNILLDPMFGDKPSPHPMLGSARFTEELPIDIDKLPKIDAVIISHDHYDHLDYGSIKKLNNKVQSFYVPLGLASHLERWGVPEDKIHELKWGDEITAGKIKLACAPSRHFSGRRLMDRYSTLWCSWIIFGQQDKIYFSGDSGYGPHFKEIGDKYGPFDLALMECGQYDTRWHEIHMLPEETAQAALDVQAKVMMPIHWGAFKLALHSWTDPVERVSLAAERANIAITTPQIGESIILNENTFPANKWWEGL